MILLDKIHPRTYIFKKMVESLGTKIQVEPCWILCMPEEISESTLSSNVLDIHSYENGLDMLEQNKPDLILVDSQIEPIQYAISLAAKKLEIPIVARPPLVNYFPTEKVESSILSKMRNFLSSKIPSDDKNNERALRRGNFFIYKLRFFFKTKLALKENFFSALFSTLSYWKQIALSRSQLSLNPLIDLHLLASEIQIQDYKKFGINEAQLKLVGNIWLDRIIEKISNPNYELNDDIKILIITTALFEHGYWNAQQRDEFLTKLLTSISKNPKFKISIKIHPTSENPTYYKELLKSLGLSIPIFQSEDLWELIPENDLFISYGSSQALGDLAFSQKRTITISVGEELKGVPLIDEGISSGFIVKCKNLEDLPDVITSTLNSIPKPNELYISERNKLFFNFDGKSPERTTNAILSFFKKS